MQFSSLPTQVPEYRKAKGNPKSAQRHTEEQTLVPPALTLRSRLPCGVSSADGGPNPGKEAAAESLRRGGQRGTRRTQVTSVRPTGAPVPAASSGGLGGEGGGHGGRERGAEWNRKLTPSAVCRRECGPRLCAAWTGSSATTSCWDEPQPVPLAVCLGNSGSAGWVAAGAPWGLGGGRACRVPVPVPLGAHLTPHRGLGHAHLL